MIVLLEHMMTQKCLHVGWHRRLKGPSLPPPPKPHLNVDSGYLPPDWHSPRARLIQEAVGYINTVMAFDTETGTRNQICMRHAMTICVTVWWVIMHLVGKVRRTRYPPTDDILPRWCARNEIAGAAAEDADNEVSVERTPVYWEFNWKLPDQSLVLHSEILT